MSASQETTKGIVRRAVRTVESGFTLLEIMVVLAIIALLAGGVGAAVFKNYKKAQVSTARLRVKAARRRGWRGSCGAVCGFSGAARRLRGAGFLPAGCSRLPGCAGCGRSAAW